MSYNTGFLEREDNLQLKKWYTLGIFHDGILKRKQKQTNILHLE